ncbi:MAG: creatininase family protein [Bacteroidales bacterium]|nr:creatininase family protein [Bacteroidales bacterium]MBN2819933.1 creatininase family protein [Bacteroidales bacterium]
MKDVLKMTWKEIEALPKDKTILFLTFAPIEEHSHHLPLGVDIFLGETWKNMAIDLIFKKNPDYHLLTMPAIPFAQGSIKGFPGCIHVSQRTVYRVTYEILKKIASWGLKNIVIIASHGDPKHLIAIEEACDKINKKHGLCAISPLGAFFSYDELGIDLDFPEKMQEMLSNYPNDYHAGWIETSAILAIDENMVKKDFRKLPDIKVEEKELIFPDKVSKKIAGFGHIGFPRLATKELGELINTNSAEYIYKATMAFVTRQDYKKYQHHSLHKIPFLRTNFMRNILSVFGLVVGMIIIYIWIIHKYQQLR